MTSFLFWNVMRKDLRREIAAAAAERNVDVLLLAESSAPDGEMAAELSTTVGREFTALSRPADKVRLFTSLPVDRWILRQTDTLRARMAIWSVAIGKPPGILLATAHFICKKNETSIGQALIAVELSTEIRRVEQTVGHARTILVGDLNMNPYEDGIIGAPALHAVMTKKIAERGERIVAGNHYKFFYNPMWGLFGDRTVGPPGTYYHRSANTNEAFWHLFDQVLLRPDLMHSLHDLTIVDTINGESLLTSSAGLPRAARYSDHLPLAFRIELD